MTAPPTGTPWWAWLLAVVGVALVTALGGALGAWLQGRPQRRDVAEIKEQVQNSHAVGLRDDLDARFASLDGALADVRTDVGGLHSEVRDSRQDIAGIRTDARRDRRAQGALRADVEHLERTVTGALEVAQAVIDEHHPGPQLRPPD